MGPLLAIFALVIGSILIPIGILFGLCYSFYHFHFGTGIKNADKKLKILSTAFDMFGNVACGELFNVCLITIESTYLFGKYGQTISYVLGMNLKNGTLTKTGNSLVNFISIFDDNHCWKAIWIYSMNKNSFQSRVKKFISEL